jgi:putative transposase
MNPVRAKMVAHPAQYPWSSYRVNAGGESSDFIMPHPEYEALGPSDEPRRERYRALFDETVGAGELRMIREAINGGLVLGREPFIAALQECFACKGVKGKGGRPRKTATGTARST